jgi:hypothetical protein
MHLRVAGLAMMPRRAPGFNDVDWESWYLYAGTGPAIDSRAVTGAAALGAGMDFDIYQIDKPQRGNDAV